MKRLLPTLTLAALAACGGSDATGPKNPTFPSVAGVYQVTGAFPSPPPALNFNGTISLSQPSREQPALTGTANLVVALSTGPITFSTINNASVSEGGLVGFNVGGSTGTASWRFTGTLSGSTITGTHILTGTSSTGAPTSFSGTFTATKQ